MAEKLSIGPVPRRKMPRAVGFLVAGRRRDRAARTRAEALAETIRRRGREHAAVWWARRRRACVAAAMIFRNPGRTGLLHHCPLDAEGVDPDALATLSRRLTDRELAGGLSLVQCIVRPGAEADADLAEAAGYRMLAELVGMRLELGALGRGGAAPPGLTWRRYGDFDECSLAELIAATYEQSHDCPRLAGRRDPADVIEGHKACGVFHPTSWWIVEVEGTAAGCVLANDTLDGAAVELAYLGVAPAFRGRGIARAMLQRAADDARARGKEAVTLTVDAANARALQVYEALGFRQTDRRLSYVRLRDEQAT